MNMSTCFLMTGIVSDIGTTRRSFRQCRSVFVNHKFHLRAVAGGAGLFNDWPSKRDEVVASRLHFQASGSGGVEVKCTRIKVCGTPLDGFCGIGNRCAVV